MYSVEAEADAAPIEGDVGVALVDWGDLGVERAGGGDLAAAEAAGVADDTGVCGRAGSSSSSSSSAASPAFLAFFFFYSRAVSANMTES